MGLFITLEEPTREMEREAGERGFLQVGVVAEGLSEDADSDGGELLGGKEFGDSESAFGVQGRASGEAEGGGAGEVGVGGGVVLKILDCFL